MHRIKVFFLCISMGFFFCVNAQNKDSLMQEIRSLAKETDPAISLFKMNEMIDKYHLHKAKDAETIDMLKGIVAMDYVEAGKYKEFDRMISSMANKFNQTSYLNMAASSLMKEDKDLKKAESLAKQTLDLYLSIKDDPDARPADFPEADWKRFMKFAFYPYNDTYARALYELGKYKEALHYQEKAFDESPEKGMPASVERFANLLVHNNQSDKAYSLLLEMAKTGKSNEGMNRLLKELYMKKGGSETAFDAFFTDLQKNVVAALKERLKKKMQDADAFQFTLKDVEGNAVSLSDFRGKIVVIDFWATWCVPCKASFPAMKKMQDRHPEVKFLFINTQEKQEGATERIKDYLSKSQYPFLVLMDQPSAENPEIFSIMSAYKVTGIPTKFIIDANGKQRFFSVGFTSDTELMNELEAMIQLAAEQG